MVDSKAWNWKALKKEDEKIWKEPSMESYYLLHRWKEQGKSDFLDLGCGLGRHTILFASNGFNTSAFDLSEDGIKATKEWANELGLKVDCKIGDMLELPYEDESFDCILCRNVISHTDTNGMIKITNELKRVLRNNGECYLTLGSKNTWGWKQDWPQVDENTKIRIEDGPENGIPHFYADYDLIKELFKDFSIEKIHEIRGFYDKGGSYHYHVLIRK